MIFLRLVKENTYKQIILSDAALHRFFRDEVGGCYPQDPAELNKELMLRGLEIPAPVVSSFIIRDGIASMNALNSIALICRQYMHMSPLFPEQTYSIQGIIDSAFTEKPNLDSEWQLYAKDLMRLEDCQCARAEARFHHHMGTGADRQKWTPTHGEYRIRQFVPSAV